MPIEKWQYKRKGSWKAHQYGVTNKVLYRDQLAPSELKAWEGVLISVIGFAIIVLAAIIILV